MNDPDYVQDWLIHDAFFRRALDKVAPGGVVAFVTSSGTLDKKNSKIREFLATCAELIGAIRLPNTAFSETGVTTDIIFLQKREVPLQAHEPKPDWCYVAPNDDGLMINSYFLQNPHMMLGTMRRTTFQDRLTCDPIEGADIEKQLNDAIRKSADWEAKAKAALASGNTDLAKRALAQKVKADEEVATYREMHETIANQTEAIKTQVETLKAKMAEAKSRQAMLIARSQMADTQKSLAKSIGGIDTSSSFEKFNRMEQKVMEKEAEAEAFSQMAGASVQKDYETFEQIQNDAKVDSELQRLMAEMGQTVPTQAGEPSLEEQIAAAEAAAEAAAGQAAVAGGEE